MKIWSHFLPLSVDVVAEEQMVEIKELLGDVAEHVREGKQTAFHLKKTFAKQRTNLGY